MEMSERMNKLEDFREFISKMSYEELIDAREQLDREISLEETVRREK